MFWSITQIVTQSPIHWLVYWLTDTPDDDVVNFESTRLCGNYHLNDHILTCVTRQTLPVAKQTDKALWFVLLSQNHNIYRRWVKPGILLLTSVIYLKTILRLLLFLEVGHPINLYWCSFSVFSDKDFFIPSWPKTTVSYIHAFHSPTKRARIHISEYWNAIFY